MPELPDITVYIEAIEARVLGQTLEDVRIAKPFLLRSVDPPMSAAKGKRVNGVRRMGKRIVLELEDDLFLVIHLMIAGRLRWLPAGGKVPGKIGLAAFDFANGTLILTEAGSKSSCFSLARSGRTITRAIRAWGTRSARLDSR
jgi:formamidopyrimidine-DNA glycosylase